MKYILIFFMSLISLQLYAQVDPQLLIGKWKVDADLTYDSLSREFKQRMKQNSTKKNLKEIMYDLEYHANSESYDPTVNFKEGLSKLYLEFKEDKSLIVFERNEQNVGSWEVIKDKNALSITTNGSDKEFEVFTLTSETLTLQVDDGGIIFKLFLKKI